MTQEFINRLFSAMMNIQKTHLVPEYWSPSSDGEATKEVRDFMAKELPEWFEKYLDYMLCHFCTNGENRTQILNAQLSIANLTEFIVKNYKEMFIEECPYCENGKVSMEERLKINPEYVTRFDCKSCNGTGLIVIEKWREAVKVIEEGKE